MCTCVSVCARVCECVVCAHMYVCVRVHVHVYVCTCVHVYVCCVCACVCVCCAVLHSLTRLCLTFWDPMDCSPPSSSVHGDSPGKNTGVGSLSLLQGTFPTQGWKPGLPHCRQILYQLSHKGSPRILGVGSLSLLQGNLPNPGIEPGSPALQVDSLPTELSGKPI